MSIVMSEDGLPGRYRATSITYGSKLDGQGRQVGAWGFEFHGTFVVDPFRSECGRFEVDPFEYYGLTKTVAAILVSKNEALDRVRTAHNIVL